MPQEGLRTPDTRIMIPLRLGSRAGFEAAGGHERGHVCGLRTPPRVGRAAAWPPAASSGLRVGEREGRRALPAHDRGRLVDELVVFDGVDNEEGEVDAAGDVALEHGVAHVAAPDGQALAVAFLEVATTHDGPAGVAGEDAAACVHLVIEVGEAGEAREAAPDVDECLEPPRVDVLAVAG